jgi:paraquat-inducible protein B
MSDQNQASGAALPKARVSKARIAWLWWLIPLGAAALCVWFVYRDFVATGPVLTILFHNADGLETGNTQVNYRGAQVGVVKSMELTPDAEYVKVKVHLISSAKNLARAGSVFWIVRPEVKIGNVSGLRTIISGEYITVQPGSGTPTNSFVAADQQPMVQDPKALHIRLVASNLSSLRELSPVIYRGLQVGEVQRYQLSATGDELLIDAMIREEYAPLVRLNSKFWNAGGINFKVGLFHGAEITAESPQTLLSGAIEFATPPETAPAAVSGAVFRLHDKVENTWKEWRPNVRLHLPERGPATITPSVGRTGPS